MVCVCVIFRSCSCNGCFLREKQVIPTFIFVVLSTSFLPEVRFGYAVRSSAFRPVIGDSHRDTCRCQLLLAVNTCRYSDTAIFTATRFLLVERIIFRSTSDTIDAVPFNFSAYTTVSMGTFSLQ